MRFLSRKLTAFALVAALAGGVVSAQLLTGTGADQGNGSDRAGSGKPGAQREYVPGSQMIDEKIQKQVQDDTRRFDKLTRAKGPAVAIRTLASTTYATDTRLRPVCHTLAHEIGAASVDEFGAAKALAFVPVSEVGLGNGTTDLCSSGYHHAVFAATMAGKPQDDLAGISAKLCEEREGVDQRSICMHGVGHGLAGSQPTETALTVCEDLEYPYYCRVGVYMQLHFNTSATKQLPCRSFAKRFKSSCYWQVGAEALDPTWDERVATCMDSEEGYVGMCINGLGTSAWRIAEQGGEPLARACGQLDRYQSDCVLGAVRFVVTMRPDDARGAREVCTAIPELTQPCMRQLGAIFASRNMDAAEVRRRCAAIMSTQVATCVAGVADRVEFDDATALAEVGSRAAGTWRT